MSSCVVGTTVSVCMRERRDPGTPKLKGVLEAYWSITCRQC